MWEMLDLRNTFFHIEIWMYEDKFTLVEINSRIYSASSPLCRDIWDVSVHHAAIYLAYGEIDKIGK